MDIELTAEEFLDEWCKLMPDVTEQYTAFHATISEMGECGVRFYLSDGVPIIDATDYINEVDDLEKLYEL